MEPDDDKKKLLRQQWNLISIQVKLERTDLSDERREVLKRSQQQVSAAILRRQNGE